MTLTTKKYYPWLIILLCSVFLFYKYILQVSPSLMTKELGSYYHLDGAGIGNLAASFFYSYVVMQLFVGPLLDRFSLRKLTTLALLVTALGGIGFALAHSLLVVELCRALIGAGAAFATVVYLKMAAVWFKPQRFAFVAGLLATAAMLGALCGQAPMAYLIERTNWREGLLIVGLLGLVVAALFYLVVRDHPSETESKAAASLNWQSVKQVIGKRQNWLLAAYSGLAFAPVVVFGGLWGNPFLQVAYHISKLQAASMISFMFVGLAIGSPLFGALSDYLNNRLLVMALGTCLSFSALVPLLYFSLPLPLVASALFLFGLGTGVFMLGFTLAKELNPLPLAATVVALINTGDAFLGAVTEPFTGRLLDLFSASHSAGFTALDYRMALSLIPVYLLVALGLLAVLAYKRSTHAKLSNISLTSAN